MYVAIPPAEDASYEMRTMSEAGDLRLELRYTRKRFPGNAETVALVIATNEEFLRIAESEVLIQ
jgi:hypothetical protein